MNIEKKLKEIYTKEGPSIIILKGFDVKNISDSKKFFSFNVDYYDKIDFETIKDLVRDDIIKRLPENIEYLWMTIEEYQLYKELEGLINLPIVVLENNLFNKQFPYRETLYNIEDVYHNLYYKEDNELESEYVDTLKKVSKFYGQIDYSKQSNKYYVTYPEFSKQPKSYKFFNESTYDFTVKEEYPTNNIYQIELSEDEIPFLDLTQNIIQKEQKKDVLFILSGSTEFLPNNYLTRIEILSNLVNVNFYFTTLSIRRKVIENENSYKKILRDIFDYQDFKEIDFYKRIESGNKETIGISQGQIIDDIVQQAEKAIHGEDFRDVYITASTGAGKSIMFQIPALFLANKYKENKPLTLVISPLIGLMNDQVDSLKRKGINNSETINGNTPPFERERILEDIQTQRVDILYLSPETLQARSDIKMLIGGRNIGTVIIDEAHIVTTWGKSFRSDYWYLGIYLSKLRKEYKFPIVTFTATAIYGGKEDMYVDTRNSLNMISPISYFGEVRREEIKMIVRSGEKALDKEGRDYRKTKNTLAFKHLEAADKNKQKSLIYFPTIKLLNDFHSFLKQNNSEIAEKTGRYNGSLKKEEKDEVLNQFKNGNLKYVLATKAFGMGIDIPDITNVYHYAPTGNVVDYIQEIGRVARDRERVPFGFGRIDFISRDMSEVNRLHGMSSIRKNQILEVMKKVLSVYKEKNNRNLIISPEDFKYIFVHSSRDEDSLDNKVKTVLLMIEKDFSSPKKLGYSPFVARPRSLYGNDMVFVNSKLEQELIKSRLGRYFNKLYDFENSNYSAVYQVNLSGIWEKHYENFSYPNFKRMLFTPDERNKLKHKTIFNKLNYASGIEIVLNENETIESVFSEYKLILNSFEKFVNNYRITDQYFEVADLGTHFKKTLKIADKFEAMTFAQSVINAAFEVTKIKNVKFISERLSRGESVSKYRIHQDGDIFVQFVLSQLKSVLRPSESYVKDNDKIIKFHLRSNSDELDSKIATLGIGESKKILNFQVVGGNNPQIYLRINSVYPLEKVIAQGDFYQNSILNDVQKKHYTSVEMLRYLFNYEADGGNVKEKIINYSNWFWDSIENYFMGNIPIEVKSKLDKVSE